MFETFYCLPLSSSYKTAHGHWPHVNICRVPCGGVVNMLLVLSITFYFHYNIWGCMCSTGPFQYRWLKGYIYSSCYYHHQIGSIHLSHCYHIFLGCVSERFVKSYSVTYCIYISGKTGIFFHYYCAVYDECKWSDTFCLEDRIRLFVHYTMSLSSLCKLIWRHWTYKMPVRYLLSSVSKIRHIISVIHYTIRRAVCFQFTHFPMMTERIYILCLIIIIKSEVWTITHCLGFGSWHNGVRCMSFCILMLLFPVGSYDNACNGAGHGKINVIRDLHSCTDNYGDVPPGSNALHASEITKARGFAACHGNSSGNTTNPRGEVRTVETRYFP